MDRPLYTTEEAIVSLWYKDGMPPIKALLAIAALAERNALAAKREGKEPKEDQPWQ